MRYRSNLALPLIECTMREQLQSIIYFCALCFIVCMYTFVYFGERTSWAQASKHSNTPHVVNVALSAVTSTQANPVTIRLVPQKREEQIPIELYVRGVVAAEMPAQFELEALKAQAIASRTYVYYMLANHQQTITNLTAHQAYLSLPELVKKWNSQQNESYRNKINEAVEQTKGQVITYQNKPIDAAFFSTSSGKTDNSEQYWTNTLPYLRSVSSAGDVQVSPYYKQQHVFKLQEVAEKLAVKTADLATMKVIQKSTSGAIMQMTIGSRSLKGRAIRQTLDLPSANFSWLIQGDTITFTTIGYGHNVGMSQYGAQAMAKQGYTASQIVKHYYTGVQVTMYKL